MIRVRVSAGLWLIAASCSSSGGKATSPLATKYLAIATVGNRGLDRAFDALDGRDHDNLVGARADLRSAAETERMFDRGLSAIAFPSAIETTARALVGVNETRAALASTAAASTSLGQLQGYESKLSAANATVEKQVRMLRTQLGFRRPTRADAGGST